ncbi:MAG: hypothetical protein AAB309_04320 [Deltaproteobacteria bacterium]
MGRSYDDGSVVALSPQAAFQLEEAGIAYTILDDDCPDEKIAAFGHDFFLEQIQWMKRFDDFLKQRVPVCAEFNLSLVYPQYYRLKAFVDSLIILSLRYREFMRRESPESIVYISGSHPEPKDGHPERSEGSQKQSRTNYSIHDLYQYAEVFFWPLLELTCQKFKVRVSKSEDKDENKLLLKQTFEGAAASQNSPLKKIIKPIYSFLKLQKFRRYYDLNQFFKDQTFLFLHVGDRDTAPVAASLIAKGATVLVKEKEKIFDMTGLRRNLISDLSHEKRKLGERLRSQFEAASYELGDEPEMIGWLSDRCQLDLDTLVFPYFQHFVREICFDMAMEVLALLEFYQRYKVNFVVARASIELFSIAPLIAAERSGFTRRVCFQHGGHARDTYVFHLEEIEFFDYFFALDPETREYLETTKNAPFLSRCEVYEYAHYLKSIPKYDQYCPRKKETICYVPTRTRLGVMMLNHLKFSSEWYYEFQKQILDYLGTREDKIFIFKYIDRDDWLGESTLLYLKKRGYPNIRLETTPFLECLDQIDRVILDFPGTSLYEAAYAGIPTLALYPRIITIRETAKRCLGRLLKPYSCPKEAVREIEVFLDDNAGKYRVEFPVTDKNPLDILRRRE